MVNGMKKNIIILFSILLISTLSLFLFKKDKTVEDMTLREKIGQMLMVYYNGDELDDYLINSLKENQPGGFIVSGANLTTYDKTK